MKSRLVIPGRGRARAVIPRRGRDQICKGAFDLNSASREPCRGFLSDKYLGQPEPGRRDLNTASLQKYKQMIDAWGGWGLFQELLKTLKRIADQHTVSIANVATRYILDKPKVAGVIIGIRLGLNDHREDNAGVFGLQLDAQDLAQIENILVRSNDLYRLIGDCGDEYRSR